MLLILGLLACGGRIAPHPAVWSQDDAVPEASGWALVGQVDSPPPTGLAADVATAPQGLVLVGDAVDSAATANWERIGTRWGAVRVLPLAGESERRVDPKGRRFDALWGDVPSWGRLDLGDHRLLWLDPTDPVDQRFWLPGAVASPEGGVVVLLPQEAPEVEQQLLEAVPASAMALLVRGGQEGNRARLPQGRWGPMELSVGPVEGGVLSPVPGSEGFHAAHRDVLEAELPAASWALRPEATLRDALAPGGWWRLDVDGEAVVVGLRRRNNDGRWVTSYRARWTRDGGWVEEGWDGVGEL